MIKLCTITILGLSAVCLTLSAGTVRLLDGKSYSGYVRFVDGDTLAIGPAKGELIKLPLAKVGYASFEPPDDQAQLQAGTSLAGKGTGLMGTYFSRPGFKGRSVYRIDEVVDFHWGMERPMFDVNRDYFSIRWTGEVEAPVTGAYTFHVDANDGAVLAVGEGFKIGQFDAQAGFVTKGKINLEGGQRYPVTLDFHDNYGTAHARLEWSGPGIPKSVIPRRQLHPVLPGADKLSASQGLLGCYFRNRFFYGDVLARVDSLIEFNWDRGPARDFVSDNYSVRWMGQLRANHDGEHTFFVTAEEGIRLWLGGQLLINEMRNQTRQEFAPKLMLKKNQRYDLRMEMVNRKGGSTMKMEWVEPARPRALIPSANFHVAFVPPPPNEESGKVDLSRTLGVFTWGRSRIASGVVSADDTSVRFAEGSTPGRISTINVARIVLQPIPEQFAERLRATVRGALLKSGDFVEGKFHSIADGSLHLDSVLFGRRAYGLLDVLAVQVDKLSDKPPPAAQFIGHLEDGSSYHLKSCRFEKGRLHLKDPSAGEFSVEPARLLELRRIERGK